MEKLYDEPVRGDWDIEPPPYGVSLEELFKDDYSVRDEPDLFDRDSLLKSLDSFKNKKPKTDIIIPDDNYVSIPKSEMWKALNISDLVLNNKTLTKDGQLNFLEITVMDGDRVSIRFRNVQYCISLIIPATSKGMDSECLSFFRSDLKTYVAYCDDEEFVIQIANEKKKYMTNMFNKYFYVKVGSKWDEDKRQVVFSDKESYDLDCYVDATAMYKILRPLAGIAERKPKNEEAKETSHVHFYGNKVIIACADKSFFAQIFSDNMVFPDCTTGISFINILSALVPDDCKVKIEISLSPAQRIQAATYEYKISGPCYSPLNSTIRQEYEDIISWLVNVEFTRIDRYTLGRITGYACTMRLSKKALAFNYEDDGGVKCVILHKDDSKDYFYTTHIDWDSKSSYPQLEESTIIDAQLLRWVLGAFKESDDTLGIFIHGDHVIFKSGRKYAVLYSINNA